MMVLFGKGYCKRLVKEMLEKFNVSEAGFDNTFV